MLMKCEKLDVGHDNSSFDVSCTCARLCSVCAVNYSLLGSTDTWTIVNPPRWSRYQEHSDVARHGLDKLNPFLLVQNWLSVIEFGLVHLEQALATTVSHAQGFLQQNLKKNSYKTHLQQRRDAGPLLSRHFIDSTSCFKATKSQLPNARIIATPLQPPKLVFFAPLNRDLPRLTI